MLAMEDTACQMPNAVTEKYRYAVEELIEVVKQPVKQIRLYEKETRDFMDRAD